MNTDYHSIIEAVSLEDLNQLARTISMENSVGNSYTMDTKQRFGQFFKRAGAFFSSMKFPVIGGFKVASNDLEAFVGKVGFMDAANKKVIVPEGFVGLWVPYADDLNKAMGQALSIEAMVLGFNKTLGRLVSDPHLLESASGIGHVGSTDAGLTKAMVALGQTYFDGKSNNIYRTLGAVTERGADVRTAHNSINEAIAKDKANPANKALLAVNRAMELSEKLMPYVDGNSRASKPGVQELIDITLQIAKEMESYGVLLFRIRQFSESLKDSMKEIKK